MARLLGMTFFLLAGGAALALFSYAPHDPSWNSTGVTLSGTQMHTENLLGLPGSFTADILWQSLGAMAGLLPLLLFLWARHVWHSGSTRSLLMRLAAGVGGLMTASAALGLLGLGDNAGLIGISAAALFAPKSAAAVFALATCLMLAGFLLFTSAGLAIAEWVALGAFLRDKAENLLAALASLIPQREKEPDDLSPPPSAAEERAEKRAKTQPRKTPKPKEAEKKPRRAPAAQPELGLEGELALPPLELLHAADGKGRKETDPQTLEKTAAQLEAVLGDFGVRGQILEAQPGPVVTLYQLEPAPGIKSSRIIALSDDIARSMSALSVRVAVVPGRNVIGIELPNPHRETVWLRELLETADYTDTTAKLPLVLGKDIAGAPVIADLTRMPHLLVAGTTGSGKSVGINAMILSLLYRLPPARCRLIMIDPKMLELSVYDNIPHLLTPVVTEPRKAVVALKWTVREMEDRYRAMSKLGVRNIEGYNQAIGAARDKGEILTRRVQTGFDPDTGQAVFEDQPLDLTDLPYIVVIVDELADLMLVAGKDIEAAIQRLSQMARAAGIHLIMATQRPSVDVITGTIKANFPTRISFQVTSKIDSRTIIGEQGAEQLLGQGDMLYMAGGGRLTRVHGPFVRDQEVEGVVSFLKRQGEPEYIEEVTRDDEEEKLFADEDDAGTRDELYDQAADLVIRKGRAATSMLQTHFSIGYNRAARIIQRMEDEGLISPPNAVGKRDVLGGRG